MKIKAILLASTLLASVMLLAANGARAATPLISGTYVLTFNTFCQATASVTTDPKTHYVRSINSIDNGKIEQTITTAVFTLATHKLRLTGTQDHGDLWFLTNNTGGNKMAQLPFSETTTYSNTATTVTITGVGTFQAIYSQIKNNVVGHADFIGVNQPGCSTVGAAQRQ
jgi:hypothetical protein